MPDSNEEVLIVGAGPTGLSMAIEMKRFGVPCRLIDRSPKPAQHSQALVVQARTLEQFERYGIADAAVQRGRKLKRGTMISEGKTVTSITLDRIPGHYPFVLFLPQNETEALLIEHLESLGGKVERGTEILAISEHGNAVDVQLRNADSKVENTSATWVVGCDGAHSAVREGLGIPFTGEAVGLNFYLGDVELEGAELPGDELRVYLHHGDVVFIGRLDEKLFRVIVALHSEQDGGKQKSGHDAELTLADFQEPMDRAGGHLHVKSAEWMTPFRVNDRRAEHIRHNHVFLAGDASHIHPPVGGQGMNTGIQDAANLAWKIAAVRGGADESLLQSYEEERGEVSERLLQSTSRALKAATTSNLWMEKLRDAVIHTATQIPFVQAQLAGFVSETAIAYHHSSAVMNSGGRGKLRAGERMPNPEIVLKGQRMCLLDSLRRAVHLVIGIGVENSDEIQKCLPGAELLFLNAESLQDGGTELSALIGDGGIVVVRPDGYVGFHGPAKDLESVQRYAQGTGLRPQEQLRDSGPTWAA
jgi:2-polyprenyl-6-methoxyphenol hydroxylase-like FAD-dependent oxidoreductase